MGGDVRDYFGPVERPVVSECSYVLPFTGRVCLAAHKVDFVWAQLTGRTNFENPAQLPCWFDLSGHCLCVCPELSRPISCIFAMSLKPESINPPIPVSLE